MKKTLSLLALALLLTVAAHAQKAQVLYFKANLPCCPARACNAMEADIRSIVEAKYSNGDVTFVVVPLADEANKDLVAKHNARSQTVVVVAKKGSNETIADVSEIVRTYARSQDKATLQKDLLAKIEEVVR